MNVFMLNLAVPKAESENGCCRVEVLFPHLYLYNCESNNYHNRFNSFLSTEWELSLPCERPFWRHSPVSDVR